MRHLLTGWTRVALAATTLLASPAVAQADDVSAWYDVPAGAGLQGSSAGVAADGSVWFTTDDTGTAPRLGQLVPAATPSVSFYPTPASTLSNSAQLRAIAVDRSANRLWFTRSDGSYGKADVGSLVAGSAQGIAVAAVPGAPIGQGLWGIDVDPVTHEAWFSEYGVKQGTSPNGGYFGNRIAHATPSSAGPAELPNIARYDAKPKGLVTDGQGGAWFVEEDPGSPGYRIAHATGGGYVEYSAGVGGSSGAGLTDVAVAKDGSVWFTDQRTNEVGRLDPSTSTVQRYRMASIVSAYGSSVPRAVEASPDGSVWVAQAASTPAFYANANAVVRLELTAAGLAATPYATGGFGAQSLAFAPSGNLWFPAFSSFGESARIGRITTTTAPGSTPTPTPGSSATPTPTPGSESTPTPAPGSAPTPASGAGPAVAPTSTPTPSIGPTTVIVKPSSTGTASISSVTTKDDAVTSNQICVGPPGNTCSLVYLLSTHEYVTGYPASASRAGAKPRKRRADIALGKLTVTLKGGETRKITVRLNPKARKALKKQRRIKATLTVSQLNASGVPVVIKKQGVTFRAGKK